MYACKLQHFPNRETRVTYYPVPAPRERKTSTSKLRASADPTLLETVPPEDRKSIGLPLVITSEFRDALPASVSRLKPGFGGDAKPTKFGNNARRRLLRSGASMESLPGGFQRCLFITGTLPGSTHDAMDAIARYSSYIVDRLKTWLYDNGASSYSAYVWERQKRGALHLHYVAYIPPTEKGNKITDGFKQYWFRLLTSLSRESGVDLFARAKGGSWKGNITVLRAEAVWCKKSVAAYLSKYLGKSANTVGGTSQDAGYFPVRWWGVSRPLIALLREQTFEQVYYTMNRRDAQIFYTDVSSWLENTSDKCYAYEHKYTGCKVTVAYNALYTGEKVWHLMRTRSVRQTNYSSNSKDSELTTIQLRSLMNRYSLTLPLVSQLLGNYTAQVAAKLRSLKPLSLVEVLELSNGFHYYLTWKYHEHPYQPQSYKADVKFLEETIAKSLEERRVARQQPPRKAGKHG